MKSSALFLFFLLATGKLWAGPPFQNDDPEPVDFRHYEFYVFGATAGSPVEHDPVGPAIEFNWGAAPNLQLHAVLPFGGILPSNDPRYFPAGVGPSAYGLTDVELGAKYRFVKETKHRPEIGTFTMIEIPTGNYAKGLGVGKVWYKLPIWIQKSWGHWTSYGGGGIQIVRQTQYRNFAYEGWLLQRDLGKKLTLGVEVFSHGPEGYATAQTRPATMIDVGGYYYIKNPGFQVLFAYGHTAIGQSANYGYLGLYWTWGAKADKGQNGFLANHLPSF
ncbi:MAG: transporter [Acidobacteriota bacterium]|nr:transporter [Acidobacteriota bacterium]